MRFYMSHALYCCYVPFSCYMPHVTCFFLELFFCPLRFCVENPTAINSYAIMIMRTFSVVLFHFQYAETCLTIQHIAWCFDVCILNRRQARMKSRAIALPKENYCICSDCVCSNFAIYGDIFTDIFTRFLFNQLLSTILFSKIITFTSFELPK